MIQERVHINDLHFEHRIWMNELRFFKDQLRIFNDQLGEVVRRWTDKEVLAQAEAFQNQFIRQDEVIDELLHEFKAHDKKLAEYAKDHPVAIDHVLFDNHVEQRDKMETFIRLYDDMKKRYMDFLRSSM